MRNHDMRKYETSWQRKRKAGHAVDTDASCQTDDGSRYLGIFRTAQTWEPFDIPFSFLSYPMPFAFRSTDIKIQLPLGRERRLRYSLVSSPRRELANCQASTEGMPPLGLGFLSHFPFPSPSSRCPIFFARARIIRNRRRAIVVQQSDFRGVFAYRRISCLSVTNFYENADART